MRKVGQFRRMSECVVIIRDGESVKACYRVDAPDTQVTLLKEMIKASKLAMTIEAIPEASGDREVLLKRIQDLVRKDVKFDPETRPVSIPEVIQRINEKNLFKDKAFGSKLKDDVIKILLTRPSKVWQAVKLKEEGNDQGNDARCVMEDMMIKANISTEEKMETILSKCTEIMESVARIHSRLDKHSSECIAVDGTLKLLQKIADRVSPSEQKEEIQETVFQCSYCEMDNHKLSDCTEKVRCMKCGLFVHKQDSCNWEKDCNKCGKPGHAARLHDVMNQADRIKIVNLHGTEAFGHFMAVGEQQSTSGSYSGRRGRGRVLGYGKRGRGGRNY